MRERDNQEFRLIAVGVNIEFLAFDNTAAILCASRIMRELVGAKNPADAGFVVYRRQSEDGWEIIHLVGPCETSIIRKKDIQDIRFISYDGKFPTLCSGTLVFETISSDGEKTRYEWSHCLRSGGNTFVKDGCEKVTKGRWSIKWGLVKDTEAFDTEARALLKKVVNANVPHGCCGGCV